MADNIDITPGTGKTVATDDCTTAGHTQIIKLAISTDGSATLIPADAANGLDVDVTRLPALPAGTNNIGDVDVLSLPAIPAGTNNIGDVDVLTINGVAPAFGSGARGATVQRVTIATDDSVPVTGTFWQATQPVSISGTITAELAAGANNIGDVDVLSVPAPLNITGGGLESGALRVTLASNSSGNLAVSGTVTANAGTNLNTSALALEAGGNLAAAATSLALLDDTVFTDDAAFTPGTSEVSAGGFMLDDTSTDLVDEGDIGIARMTGDRKQIVAIGESGANFVRGGGNKTDTTDQSIMAASGSASIYNYLCWVAVYNSSSTNTYVNVKDGSTVVAVLPLPAYGGAVMTFPVPIRGTGNTAFNLATGASVTTASLYGGGYKGA